MGRYHMRPAEFGFYDKCKENEFTLMSGNTISENGERFSQNDFVIDNREGTQICQNLSGPSQVPFYNSSRINKDYRSPLIHYTGRGNCKDLVEIPSGATTCISMGENELMVSNNIKYQAKNRINLVDRKFQVLEWPKSFSV